MGKYKTINYNPDEEKTLLHAFTQIYWFFICRKHICQNIQYIPNIKNHSICHIVFVFVKRENLYLSYSDKLDKPQKSAGIPTSSMVDGCYSPFLTEPLHTGGDTLKYTCNKKSRRASQWLLLASALTEAAYTTSQFIEQKLRMI